MKPRALLPGCERDIGLGPFPWPIVFLAVEAGGAKPVLPREVVGVANPHSPLLRRVHEEEPAERPERLPTEVVTWFLIKDDDPPARGYELTCGGEPCESGADYDRICIECGQCQFSVEIRGPACTCHDMRPTIQA